MSASHIQNADELKSVLDEMYANQNIEKYTPLRLYIDEMVRTSRIFYQKPSKTKKIMASVLKSSGIIADEKRYVVRAAKSCTASSVTSEATSIDLGAGAYVDIEILMRNIAKCCGVKLNSNLISLSPTIYSDLYNIIFNYYSEDSKLKNNFPTILSKYVQELESGYKSFIPYDLIISFINYFNDLRLFDGIDVNIYQPYNVCIDEVIEHPTMSKSSFLDLVEKLELASYSYTHTDIYDTIVAVLDLYGDEIDFENELVGISLGYNNLCHVNVVPKDAALDWGGYYSLPTINNNAIYSYGGVSCYLDRDWTFRQYVYNPSSQGHTKTVREITANSRVNFREVLNTFTTYNVFFSNLTTKGMYQNYSYAGLKSFTDLVYNVDYNLDDLKLLNRTDFTNKICCNRNVLNNIIKHFNIDVEGKLCYFITTTGSYGELYPKSGCLVVFEDLETFKYQRLKDEARLISLDRYGSLPLYTMSGSGISFSMPSVIGFGDSSNYNTFIVSDSEYTANLYMYDSSANDYFMSTQVTNKLAYGFSDEIMASMWGGGYNTLLFSNLGKFNSFNSASYPGVSLIPDSVYPISVSDFKSLISLYPNWYSFSANNPYWINNILYPPTQIRYLACSISKNITTQDEAQFAALPLDEIDDIIKDIDMAVDDNDGDPETPPDPDPEEDPDVNPNDDLPSKNIGDTPEIPDIDDLPDVLAGGFIKQYMMTESQLQNFATKCLDASVWASIAKLFVNPAEAIISLQMGYAYNAVGGESTNVIFNGRPWENVGGYKLASQYYDDDSNNVIDLSPYFNNYTDYTDTDVELYLPFIGYINLDVDKFINGQIKLKYRIDTLTGIIIYYVFSIRDGKTQLLHIFDGNCQVQVPVTSSDYSRLYGAIFGIAAGVATKGLSIGSEFLSSGSMSYAESMNKLNRSGEANYDLDLFGSRAQSYKQIRGLNESSDFAAAFNDLYNRR